MAKIRVSTLAKEIGVASKDVVTFLSKQGITVVAQNNIDEATQEMVKKRFSLKDSPASNKELKDKKEEKLMEKSVKNLNKENRKEEVKETRKEEQKDSKKDDIKKKKPAISVVFNAPSKSKSSSGNSFKSGSKNRDKRKNGDFSNNKFKNQSNYRPTIIKPRGGHGPIREDGTRIGEPTLEEKRRLEKEEAKSNVSSSSNVKAHEKNILSEKDNFARKNNEKHNKDKFNKKSGNNFNKDNNKKDRNFDKKKNNKKLNLAEIQDGMSTQKESARKQNYKDKKKHKKDYNKEIENEKFINLEKPSLKKKKNNNEPKTKEEEIKSIKVPEHITIRELAERMKMNPSQIIKDAFAKAVMLTINTDVPYEKAEEIALEYDILCEKEEKVDIIKEMLSEDEDDESTLVERPPVVCVMGHVDHGKTSLLDAIRDTSVSEREAGGITQRIGAYVVSSKGRKITFLDTPGHEAFTAMRMRGASSTDIAILVVAADDGVMPQTVEAINHAKAAGVEIIVAINKIDKPNANIERVKQELSEYELISEDWGGSTTFVPVSAKTGEGIDTLLEMILLTADVMELKANPKRKARGLVIESQLDKGRGVVATVLVQKGTLHVGDPISAGSSYGKIRAMVDENGKRMKAAGPSMPVEIQGLNEVPNSGEIFVVHDSEKEARNFAQAFLNEEKNKLVEESRSRMSLDNLFSQVKAGDLKQLNIIVKADVQGSVEAVKQSLEKLSNDEIAVKVIHGGVGNISESDVVLASASNAIIIGFNVRPDTVAKGIAERENTDIHLYNVIYKAIEDVERAMKGMLEPIYEEKVIGHGEVRMTFKSSKVGIIAGCIVNDGEFRRGCKIRLKRGDEELYDGVLSSLKRMKDDVKEVKEGFECGVVLDNFNDIMEGDTIETYIMVEVPRE